MKEHLSITDCKAPQARLLAADAGWSVHDFVCTAGPGDRAFEEQHSGASVAVVLSGTFQYRTSTGNELMSPGSLLLGNSGEAFTCGHEHGTGDRCLAFHYSEEFLEHAGLGAERQCFRVARIPAIRPLSPLIASATALLRRDAEAPDLEEIAWKMIDGAARLQEGLAQRHSNSDPAACARVTRVLRVIEAEPDAPHTLPDLAAQARLSPWHFLRCFQDLTGTTPRQYLLRTRLRRAATHLCQETNRTILDIAFECGFGDVSNFNRAFRAEFGRSPRAFRAA